MGNNNRDKNLLTSRDESEREPTRSGASARTCPHSGSAKRADWTGGGI